MSNEKHEMVCYNDDYYICVYTRQEEKKCCCFSLYDLTKDCKNNTKGELFPVFIIVDIEYLKMVVNLSILSIPHPDLAVAFLCPDGKLYIRLIEVKRIRPDSNEKFKVIQIRKAINDQLVNFFYSTKEVIIKKFSNVDENNIKYVLVVPQNTYEEINEILNPYELPKLLRKFNLPDLRSSAIKALATRRVKPTPCIALDSSCYSG